MVVEAVVVIVEHAMRLLLEEVRMKLIAIIVDTSTIKLYTYHIIYLLLCLHHISL